MITVRIGTTERAHGDVDAQWVHEQVRGWASEHGTPPCVQIKVDVPGINVILQTQATCGSQKVTGVRREQAEDERRLFDRWNTLHLNDADWQAGNLNAFLQQLDRLV